MEPNNNSAPEVPVSETPAPEAPTVSTEPTDAPKPTPQPEAKPAKSNKPLIWCLAILAIIGIVAAAVFAYLYFTTPTTPAPTPNNNQSSTIEQTATNEDNSSASVIKSEKIDNEVAQNIIDPYIKNFGTFDNLLDYDFDVNSKLKVTFDNVDTNRIIPIGDYQFDISYYDINETYKHLFGDEADLEKISYEPPFLNQFTFDNDRFHIEPSGIGGTGGKMFSIVKEARYEDGTLTVDVYHDSIPWCADDEDEKTDYCYIRDNASTPALFVETVKQKFEKHGDNIPVYEMVFKENAGHYVLKGYKKL